MELVEFLFLGVGTYYDIKNQELPIPFLLVFGILAILLNLIFPYQTIQNVLTGAGIGGVFLFTSWMTKEAIGYGDGIGLVILGIFEGWQGLLPIVFGAFLLSGVYGVWRLIGYKEMRTETMPFYPFLLIAFIGVMIL